MTSRSPACADDRPRSAGGWLVGAVWLWCLLASLTARAAAPAPPSQTPPPTDPDDVTPIPDDDPFAPEEDAPDASPPEDDADTDGEADEPDDTAPGDSTRPWRDDDFLGAERPGGRGPRPPPGARPPPPVTPSELDDADGPPDGTAPDGTAPEEPAPDRPAPEQTTTNEVGEVIDLADPLGPVDAMLDALADQPGITIGERNRSVVALRGETLTVTLRGADGELLQYMLERVADDGYQLLLEPIAIDTFQLVALRARIGQRGLWLVNVDNVSITGRFRAGDDRQTLEKIVTAPVGGVLDADVIEQLRAIGYRARLSAAGAGEIAIVVAPGRAIRRVRVHGEIPLSERELRRVLSPLARPGALTRGTCVDLRQLRQGKRPPVCDDGDLACKAWAQHEIDRLSRYLHDNGYLRGTAKLQLSCGRGRLGRTARVRASQEADLHVYLDKGPAYRVRGMKVTGNLSTQDQRWVRRVFRPTVSPFIPIPKRVTRTHIERAKEKVAREYATPRTSLNAGARRRLLLPYPGVTVDTNFDDLTGKDMPAGRHLPLEVDIQLGNGVQTAFLGNRHITDNRLRSQLQLFQRREPAAEATARREAATLRNYLQSRGFILASVRGRYEDFGTLKRLTFVIEEGPRARIRDLDLMRPKNVPPVVMNEIVRAWGKQRQLGKRGRFTDANARTDLASLLAAFNERGYLCARAQLRVAFWRSGLDERGANAVIDPMTELESTGDPAWLQRQIDASGLSAVRQRNRTGIYVRVEIAPGPRVVTSGREKVRHLEQRVPATRETEDAVVTQGAWGAPRILRDGPLRREDDDRAGGIPLHLTLARETERAIVEKYRRSGYPLADAEVRWVYQARDGTTHRVPQADRLTDSDVGICRELGDEPVATVDTEISVHEGRRGVFGTTLTRGNFKTADYVLRRERQREWKEGDVYDAGAVADARAHIEGIGVTESVGISETESGCDIGAEQDQCVVDHVVTITESKDRAMDLSWGIGAATLNPLYAFVRPGFPNVWGTAWDINLDALVGANVLTETICGGESCYERSGRAAITRQRIFASPLTFSLTGQVQRRVTPARGQIDSALGEVRLTLPVTDEVRLYWGYLVQVANISKDVVKPTLGDATGCGVDGQAACRPPNRAEAIVPDRTGALETGVAWAHNVDNEFNPDQGFIASFDALWASPYFGGLDWWVRGEAAWQHFVPVPRTDRRLNFRYSLRYGHAIPLPGLPGATTTSIPEVWRYFGGGTPDLGIRGIEPQTMLVDIEEVVTPFGVLALRPIAQGGHIRALGTVALQVVSVPNFLGGRLAHSLFTDVGVLTQRWRHVRLARDLRRSVGVNFIVWNIGIVSVAVGYAVLVPNAIFPGNVRPTDDRNGRFVFDVGATF